MKIAWFGLDVANFEKTRRLFKQEYKDVLFEQINSLDLPPQSISKDYNFLIYDLSFPESADKLIIESAGKRPIIVISRYNNKKIRARIRALPVRAFWQSAKLSSLEIKITIDGLLKQVDLSLSLEALESKQQKGDFQLIDFIKKSPTGIMLLNENAAIIYVNPAFERIFRIRQAEIISDKFPYPFNLNQFSTINLEKLTGRYLPVRIKISDWNWDGRITYVVSFCDLRKEYKMQQLVKRLRTFTEHSPSSLIVTNADGKIQFVNPKFCEVSGYQRGELIGQNPGILKSGEHSQQYYQEMWQTIKRGEIWENEICNKNKQGNKYWERMIIAPVIDKQDKVSHFLGIRVDDTERRRAEDALRKAEALKSVQELAGGIAHEFSQPLQVLTIIVSLLMEQNPSDPNYARAQKMVNRIIDLVNNLKNITTIRQQSYLSSKIIDLKASAEKAGDENGQFALDEHEF